YLLRLLHGAACNVGNTCLPDIKSKICTLKSHKLAGVSDHTMSINPISKQSLYLKNELQYALAAFFPLLFVLIFLNPAAAQDSQGHYRNGMVVCATPAAALVGLDILKKGGNAVDAAVAVQFALEVTHPEAGNIGGGGFMVYRSADGKTNTLDFREKAPEQASQNMFLDSAGNVIPNMSLATHQASGVPGSVDGMVEAHRKYGKLPWDVLVQPAIGLARSGFKITRRLASELNYARAQFMKLNPGKNYLLREGGWREGDLLVQDDLANTLELIRDKGRDGFYSGLVADEIVAEMSKGNGIITKSDLANYHAVWRDAIVGHYKGYKIITMPPPSSGGIALLQLLQSVENYSLRRWGFNKDSTV